jgi:uncharacterized protein (TIGR03435 family)
LSLCSQGSGLQIDRGFATFSDYRLPPAKYGACCSGVACRPRADPSCMRLDGQVFDVASVKPSKSENPPYSNFPLEPGDVYAPNGGFFSATSLPRITYIFFAYRISGNQSQYLLPQLPGWVTAEWFDIQARAEGNPSKDQMRLMMPSLLADRFKLATHNETREVPVFAYVLTKNGKTGPQLRPHLDNSPCPTNAPPPSASASGQTRSPSQSVGGKLPALCNGIFPMPPKRDWPLTVRRDGAPSMGKTGRAGSKDSGWTADARCSNGSTWRWAGCGHRHRQGCDKRPRV